MMEIQSKINFAYVFQVAAVMILFAYPAFSSGKRSPKNGEYNNTYAGEAILTITEELAIFTGNNITCGPRVNLYPNVKLPATGQAIQRLDHPRIDFFKIGEILFFHRDPTANGDQ